MVLFCIVSCTSLYVYTLLEACSKINYLTWQCKHNSVCVARNSAYILANLLSTRAYTQTDIILNQQNVHEFPIKYFRVNKAIKCERQCTFVYAAIRHSRVPFCIHIHTYIQKHENKTFWLFLVAATDDSIYTVYTMENSDTKQCNFSLAHSTSYTIIIWQRTKASSIFGYELMTIISKNV